MEKGCEICSIRLKTSNAPGNFLANLTPPLHLQAEPGSQGALRGPTPS